MAIYAYRGRNAQGELMTGHLESANADMAASQLIERGLTPVEIQEYNHQQTLAERWKSWRSSGRVETADLIMFCRQMYTITKAGVPLVKGIRGLAVSLPHPTFKAVIEDVADRLETGQELNVSMRAHPAVFNRLFINLISVGESSGQLDKIFLQLGEYLERDLETVNRIKTALRYPSFVLAALTVAIVVVNIWVIPAFADMFSRFGTSLPLPTQILLAVSDFFVHGWPYLLVILVGGGYALYCYIRTKEGSFLWGKKKLRLPIVGDIIERASMARYARSFGLMMQAGLPLPSALELCARVIDNPYLGEKIRGIRAGVERGESLFHTHMMSGMFTPLVLQMVSVGEESGHIDSLMLDVAEFYEREVDYDIKRLSDRIEPVIIVIMAAFVLILALGIFLPMWNLYAIQQ